MEISLQITAAGGIRMLHDDHVDLSEFGEIKVSRASHVEFSDGNHTSDNGYANGIPKGWYVQSAATLDILKDGLTTRAEALAWEKQHYSPGGAGWAELTGDR